MSNEDDEKSDLEARRQKNLKEREEFLKSFMKNPLFAEAIKGIRLLEEETTKNVSKQPTKRKRDDSNFRFSGAVPLERRSSARLQNKKPDFTHVDLPPERDVPGDGDWIDDLEEVVYQVKRKKTSRRSVPPVRVIPVEEVTEKMISEIQTHGNKVYGPNGTSCHQCRQKTLDTKTICRSGFCVGVRGQFCGICVINRYGEDPVAVLKDPNWKCYVCRGCCNCSFCRAKEGKRPTGILAPLAKTQGFKSVMDFLRSLNGYGDYMEPEKNPNNLLGFDKGDAIVEGNQRIKLNCQYDSVKSQFDLLGFKSGDAVMGDGKKVKMTFDNDGRSLLGFDENEAVMEDERVKIGFYCDPDEFRRFVN